MKIVYVGLDGEMTGGSYNASVKHVLIQIGVALGAANTFCSDIGWALEEIDQDPDAMAVNKFTNERIAAGPPAAMVDESLSQWLLALGFRERQLIPVGWNVAGFDMPFVRRTLPGAERFFSRRTADLNAICFALDGKPAWASDGKLAPRSWEWWKKQSKLHAVHLLGREQFHDAGFDAAASLLAFEFLKGAIARC